MRFDSLFLWIFALTVSLSSFTGRSYPPAMQGVLLGTGFPAPDPERAGPSNAVLVGDKVFIVDTGRGVTMRLSAIDPRPSRPWPTPTRLPRA